MKDALTEGLLWGPQDIALGLQPPWEAWAKNSRFPNAEVYSVPKKADEHPPAHPAAELPRAPGCMVDTVQPRPPGPGMCNMEDRNRQGYFPAPLVNSSRDSANLNTTDNSSFWDSTQCYFQQSSVVLEHLQPAQVKQFAQRKCSMKGKHKSMHRKRPESPSFLIHHTALGIKYSLKIYIINC